MQTNWPPIAYDTVASLGTFPSDYSPGDQHNLEISTRLSQGEEAFKEGICAQDSSILSLAGVPKHAHNYPYGRETTSVVFRRIVDDDDVCSSVVDEEEETEYLSLATDGDQEVEDGRVGPSSKDEEKVIPATLMKPSMVEETVPWRRKRFNRGRSLRSPLLELHQDILDFCEFVTPTPDEHQLREAAVLRVAKVVKSIWTQSQVKVFGSFATGLYLPTSDIDVVILNSGCGDIQSGLRALAKALAKDAIAKNLQVIAKARVPIVKFVEIKSLISFDISFDLQSGPEAAKFIKDALNAVPPLKPLCLVLKIFLQQRELNEVYTGGLGSYALLVMLLAHLQTHPSRLNSGASTNSNTVEHNLGVLLVDFLELYGRSLNVKDVGISCRDGGRFFKKKERGFIDSKRSFLLSVEDPQTPASDIGKNSFNFQKVRFAFMLAHRHLTSIDLEDSVMQASLLARIVRVDEKLAARKLSMPLIQLEKSSVVVEDEHNFPRGGIEGESSSRKGKKRKRANKFLHGEQNTVHVEKKHKRTKKPKHGESNFNGKHKKADYARPSNHPRISASLPYQNNKGIRQGVKKGRVINVNNNVRGLDAYYFPTSLHDEIILQNRKQGLLGYNEIELNPAWRDFMSASTSKIPIRQGYRR